MSRRGHHCQSVWAQLLWETQTELQSVTKVTSSILMVQIIIVLHIEKYPLVIVIARIVPKTEKWILQNYLSQLYTPYCWLNGLLMYSQCRHICFLKNRVWSLLQSGILDFSSAVTLKSYFRILFWVSIEISLFLLTGSQIANWLPGLSVEFVHSPNMIILLQADGSQVNVRI